MRFGKYDVMVMSLFGERPLIASSNSREGEMGEGNESLRLSPFNIIIPAIAMLPAAWVRAEGLPAPASGTKAAARAGV